MYGLSKLRGDFIRMRVRVLVAYFHFSDSFQSRERINIGRGKVTLCVHCDFQRVVWIALRVVGVRYPILAKSHHLA
jgi:hypothetical protein